MDADVSTSQRFDAFQRTKEHVGEIHFRNTLRVGFVVGAVTFKVDEEISDYVFFFKIQNNLMDIPFPNDMVEYHRSQRLHHIHNYRQLPSSANANKYSFFVRTIVI